MDRVKIHKEIQIGLKLTFSELKNRKKGIKTMLINYKEYIYTLGLLVYNLMIIISIWISKIKLLSKG